MVLLTESEQFVHISAVTYVQFTVTIARIRTYFLDIWQFSNARIC